MGDDGSYESDLEISRFILPSLQEITKESLLKLKVQSSDGDHRIHEIRIDSLYEMDHPSSFNDCSPFSSQLLTSDRLSRVSERREKMPSAFSFEDQLPEWVGHLRDKWENEIKFNMNSQAQNWFLKQQMEVLEQRDEVSESDFERSYFSLSLDSEEDQLPVEEIEEKTKKTFKGVGRILSRPRSRGSLMRVYSKKAVHISERVKKYLGKLKDEFEKTKRRFESDLEKIPQWAPLSLTLICRNYYQNKLLWLTHRQKLQAFRIQSLNVYKNDCEAALKGDFSRAKLLETDKGKLVEPSQLELTEDLAELERSCDGMESVLEELKNEYFRVKKESERKETTEMRSIRMRKLLVRSVENRIFDANLNLYFHPVDGIVQDEFNRFMLDIRYREGKSLQKWFDITLDTFEKGFSVKALHSSRNAITRIVFDSCGINANEPLTEDPDSFPSKPFLLMLDRLIFPKLASIWVSFIGIHYGDGKLNQLRTSAEKLKQLDQSEFGIPLKYQKIDGTAYERSIRILSRIDDECRMVPSDIVGVLVLCIDCVVEEAKEYCTKKFEFGADDLVPILEWVLVHCEGQMVYESILHALLVFDVNTGRAAFCLAQFQSAMYGLLRKP